MVSPGIKQDRPKKHDSLRATGRFMLTQYLIALALSATLLSGGSAHLSAQTSVGVQASFGTEGNFGLGVRLRQDVSSLIEDVSGLLGTVSFDYFFAEDPIQIHVPEETLSFEVSYFEINANVSYDLPIARLRFLPYVGSGLNIARTSVQLSDESGSITIADWVGGLNVLVGATFGSGPFRPFMEIRVERAGGEQVVISGGLIL